MGRLNVSKVAGILITNEYLITGRNDFMNLLNIDAGTKEQLENRFNNGTITPKDYFCRILEIWEGRLGNGATIEKLCTCLEEGGFIGARDYLRSLAPDILAAPTPQGSSVSSRTTMFLSDPKIRKQVSKILMEDTEMFTNWGKFCSSLEISPVRIMEMRQQLQTGVIAGSYDLMERILSTWGSQNGCAANVEKLCDILRNDKFGTSEEKLMVTFSS
ncbi:uncharacterized protein LOC110863643 [Folsomia candida]|uniref:uncharacterized protein LOC110863643 n=1 Tax=Folsomia candida TaxID=158441 RepID=UPI000B902AD9|nr:uncharacterized protein LOC110863643 [Folsomia candida]